MKYLISILGLLSLASVSLAQTSFMSVPNDAKSLSMGSTGVASSASAYSLFNNVAATATSEDFTSVGLNYTYWQPSYAEAQTMSFAGFIKPTDKLALSLGYRYEMLPSQKYIDEIGTEGANFSPMGMSIDLGVAYNIVKGFSAGLNLRYINTSLIDKTNSAFSADVHFMYQLARSNIGLTVNNLGTESGPIVQPMNIKIGGSYELLNMQFHKLTPQVQVGYILSPSDITSITASIGLEYSFDSKYYVRAGYSYADDTKFMPDHASVGLGVRFRGFAVDAAYLIATGSNNPIKNTFSVNLSWSLTK